MFRFALIAGWLLVVGSGPAFTQTDKRPPNFIVIFADDLGYGDVGCYGAKGFKTPNLDRMAAEGLRFNSFYTGCAVCTGSRAALLTGRHYQRVGVPPVMFPNNKQGLNPNEITIARLLSKLGYATGIIGKWHLGHLAAFLPMQHGFQFFYGLPYSNDMSLDAANSKFAENAVFREGFDLEKARTSKPVGRKVPLMRGDQVIEYPADQSTLTKRYTEEAIRFIKANKDRPFFLYLPHTMPHEPLAASADFKGRTKTVFGDVMEELDWSVGEILKSLKDAGVDDKTLVIFTSDNGAHQGSAGPLRGKKATMYEGGFRVPCIVRWAGKTPVNVASDEVVATVDVLPTLAKLAGGEPPADRPIDGKDIRPLLFGEPGAKSPHEYYLFPHGNGALRSGPWKFYPWPEGAAKNAKTDDPKRMQLYDVTKDIGEKINLAAHHPEIVNRLYTVYQQMTADISKNKLP